MAQELLNKVSFEAELLSSDDLSLLIRSTLVSLPHLLSLLLDLLDRFHGSFGKILLSLLV